MWCRAPEERMPLSCAERGALSSDGRRGRAAAFFGPNPARARYDACWMSADSPPSVVCAARLCARLAVIAIACLAAGCGAAKDPDAGNRIVLRYWDKWTGFEADAMRRVVDDFNASQDRIYVDFSSVSGVDKKVMLATAGGVPPDIAGLFSVLVPIYADNNALIPLDKLAAEAGIRRENYIDVFWQVCEYRDHLWALPTTPDCTVLVWNK